MSTSKNVIFIVDDDPDDFLFLKESFEERCDSIDLRHFENPVEFISALSGLTPPCLIVLDINMPKVNGFRVLKALRSEENWKKIPVAFLTTSSHPGDIFQAREFGVSEYYVKPIEGSKWDEIADRLVSLCESHDLIPFRKMA